MKALLISADGFEDSELLVPYYRFLEEGIEIDIASIKSDPIIGKHGYHVTTTRSLDKVDSSLYDILILPGGKAPTLLRNNEKMLDLVRQFIKDGKTVAAICHGPQILVSAGVLSGRRATCYKNVAEELEKAGCSYSDEQVVVDDNLITSRVPADLPAFMREIMKKCRKPTGLDKKKLALIHIVKRDLHLSDQEYRDILQQVTGVRSAKDLDETAFNRLLRYFARSKQYQINPYGLTFRQKYFIKHLLADLHWDEGHFHNFLKKYYQKTGIDDLTKGEASNVIESLKNIIKHTVRNSQPDT
ncbi:MAG: DJ-1/PfpI/YhbO family deglycase/protease [Proteobacteria bacterium]|jgi:protease I|nr:DJ-1/PfpI/YhbO family deglycase/protease [Desulfocapsa sp.]MBU3944985.1 DJ-1/PfpI/YhbO family deglycase/protease [Pseudomonadota bacterium]MCG2745533.1 DJ-1/PfpI/YhbO family deglycase/protease [Desulfobacteraceae bacterium]MBU3983050.1 DJ-1/PfpI/YhbO family deglycase/protease [Pseudomonadota bacterium]MBU4029081.1 DJ-1/PfpI/YhbO family deglycase/protease [Pseudomonadota bacterium]